MKLLIATGETRGTDFNWCDDDELVLPPTTACENGDTCGCNSAWVGAKTLKHTTFAKVADVDMTARRLKELILDAAIRMGYLDRGATTHVSFVRASYLEIVNAARAHEADTVLRYSHNGPSVVTGKDEETTV